MKTVQNLTLTLILTLTLKLSQTLSLTLKKETKERNLEKGEKREPSGFELPTLKLTVLHAITQSTVLDGNSLQVIDKKLVLSLTWLSFPLVRFRLDPPPPLT